LVNSTSQVVVASTYAKLPYSVADDFIPISALADIPFVVSTTTHYKSMKDVVAASSKPGGIFYGTNGPGSSGHLFMEALRLAAGYPITHVPFRGTVEAMTEVIAGRIDMFPAPALNAINLTKEGKVNSLAVSSPKRLPLMAEVPTLAEVGLPKAQYQFWVGSFAPAKTPKAIVERLNREVVAALHVKETADRIIALGGSPMPMTPAEFDAFVRREIALNGEIVKASGYQPQ
jgi:tripartite-type tricarboxylate transporter receptor subunit TctC